MSILRRAALVLTATLAAGAMAAPAAAAEPVFGPRRSLAAPACAASGASSSTGAAYGGGRVRAFTGFYGRHCAGRITFSTGGSSGYAQTASPYRGVVLAVAADEVATYLLYERWDSAQRPLGLGVTKRTHDGTFFPTTVVSTVAGTGAVATTGDIVARNGRWWAVWSEQVGPGGEFAQTELFQAGTYSAVPRRKTRFTTTAASVDDLEPSLSLDAKGAVLAWTRQSQPAIPGPSDIWVAVSESGAWTGSRNFASAGTNNSEPDVARVGTVTMIGFSRDGRIVAADNSTGVFREHLFLVRGGEPRVGVTTGSMLTSWTAGTETDASYRALFARTNAGGTAWESAYLSSFGEPLHAMVAVHGRATVVVGARASVFSRTGG